MIVCIRVHSKVGDDYCRLLYNVCICIRLVGIALVVGVIGIVLIVIRERVSPRDLSVVQCAGTCVTQMSEIRPLRHTTVPKYPNHTVPLEKVFSGPIVCVHLELISTWFFNNLWQSFWSDCFVDIHRLNSPENQLYTLKSNVSHEILYTAGTNTDGKLIKSSFTISDKRRECMFTTYYHTHPWDSRILITHTKLYIPLVFLCVPPLLKPLWSCTIGSHKKILRTELVKT